MVASTSWDSIVVGGGLAGTVVTSRLSQYQPSARILMIEAGPDVSKNTDILQSKMFMVGGEFDWSFKSTPQKSYNGRIIDIPAGRAVGGGSAINACGWLRGAKDDFDSWAEIVGDQRWSYEGQLPYFKKTEKWYNHDNPEAHGHDGTFHIESPLSTGRIYPLADIYEQSWKELGVNKVQGYDINAGYNLGLGEGCQNSHDGVRQITPLVYPLDGVTVLMETLVESILIEKGPEARTTGVRPANGTEIYSEQEVIVATGAYKTPQILMLSGLGSKETLDQHGIETNVDIPERLRDPSKGYALGSNNPLFLEPQFGSGIPLSYVVNTDVPRDSLITAIAKDEGKTPNSDHYLLKRQFAQMEYLLLYVPAPPLQVDGTNISLELMSMKPTSRGVVTIPSRNPADAPLLDPQYFATEVDKYVLRESVRTAASLMTGNTRLGREVIAAETPPSGTEPLTTNASDEYIDYRIRTEAAASFHGSSSCSMGTVVDTELRVKGVKNLRIVDASVFPISIGAHIQAPIYALAEQAAIIISNARDN